MFMLERLWAATNDDGFEHLRLSVSADGVIADGMIVRRSAERHWRTRYLIECRRSWRVRSVTLEGDAQLRLSHDEVWRVGSRDEPSLDSCIDVDIFASPFTNSLAINRLALTIDASATIDVVFIDPRDGSTRNVTQRYTRTGDRLYRYESLDSGFATHLPVDEHGLLLEYPGFFKRVW